MIPVGTVLALLVQKEEDLARVNELEAVKQQVKKEERKEEEKWWVDCSLALL